MDHRLAGKLPGKHPGNRRTPLPKEKPLTALDIFHFRGLHYAGDLNAEAKEGIFLYRLELHCHNSEVSACSSCPAETLIQRYRAAGYHGIVSTNHINRGTYQRMEDTPWQEKAEHFIRGWEALKAAAGSDFDVLLGYFAARARAARDLAQARGRPGKVCVFALSAALPGL